MKQILLLVALFGLLLGPNVAMADTVKVSESDILSIVEMEGVRTSASSEPDLTIVKSCIIQTGYPRAGEGRRIFVSCDGTSVVYEAPSRVKNDETLLSAVTSKMIEAGLAPKPCFARVTGGGQLEMRCSFYQFKN